MTHMFKPDSDAPKAVKLMAGRVRIVKPVPSDGETSMFRVHNVGNGWECDAFADELEELE